MAEFPVELLKGHDNSPNGFKTLAYIQLPIWLARKIMGRWNKDDNEHLLFQVIEETDKGYKILYCKDSSMSYEFVRPTWYTDCVAKSVVLNTRLDIEVYEIEMQQYYLKKRGLNK